MNKPARANPLLLICAAIALVVFGYILRDLPLLPQRTMSASGVYHVVAFKVSDPATLPELTESMLLLKEDCTRDGRPYIASVKGGKQSSTEGHDGGMQVVFIVEFKNQDDCDYYVHTDAAHGIFKDKLKGWGLEAVTVLDFTPGAF